MANRVHAGLIVAAVTATSAFGCSSDPQPTPPVDSGMTNVADVAPTDRPTDTPQPTDVSDGGMCPSVAFIALQDNQILGVSNDANRDCSDGFSFNVQVATNAPTGTSLELLVNSRVAGTARVTSPSVTFTNVTLDTGSPSTLSVRVAGTTTACQSVTLSVNCNAPRCQISRPMRSALNLADGVMGATPFSVNFAISTNVEDGREVTLAVSSRPTPLRATVMGGTATFNAVPLSPDGDHRVRATCTNAAGNVGTSAETTFTVDSTPPALTVTSPMPGATIGISGDVNAMRDGTQFRVCAHSDAAGQQLCAAIGSGMPDTPNGCAAVASSATADNCVEVTCPTGGTPFDVNVTTQDTAGNRTTSTLAGIRCQSALPSVRVAAPAAYVMGMDGTVLNASRDSDPMTAGLQTNVVACADRTVGMARLLVNGVPTGTPAALGPTVAGDPCAALGMGLSGIARWTNVTLPESAPERDVASAPQPTAPVLSVEVTDAASDVGRSPGVTLYIDSRSPELSIFGCNRVVTLGSGTTATTDIDVASNVFPLTLTLRHGTDTPTTLVASTPSTPGRARFPAVPLQPGDTTLSASATDPAGNAGTFPATGTTCNVTVGNPPSLSFVSPTTAQVFNRSTDADPATAGFQNVTVRLRSDAAAGTVVTLTVGTAAPVTSTVASDGTVTFGPLTLPEGAAVRLSATTAVIPGRGVGTASVTVVVDTTPPTNASTLAMTVPAAERRLGTLHLAYTNGSDPVLGGTPVALHHYEVRYGTAPITATNFAAQTVASASAGTGAPGSAGTFDIQHARLGQQYYAAMRAFNVAGNPSGDLATVGPVSLDLVVDHIVSMPGGTTPAISLGRTVTGGFDLNGDSLADVVASSGIGYVRLLFGSATTPGSTFADIVGPTAPAAGFGTAAVSVGDVNGDGLGDVLVGYGANRSAYLYFGRRTWPTAPASLAPADANVTITAGAGDLASSFFGQVIARAGDFNGDGVSDFAIAAPGPNLSDTTSVQPGVVYVFFGHAAGAAWPASLTTDNANVVISYDVPRGFFGAAIAPISRAVGGDSRDDLAILAAAADSTESAGGLSVKRGRVLVFAGRPAATPVTLTPADRAFEVIGESTTARLGSIGGVGDIDGDGRVDLAVGAGIGAGSVRLFFGNSTGTGFTTATTLSGNTGTSGTWGSVIGSITDPTQVHPSLLLAPNTSADLLLGEISHLGNTQPWFYASVGRAQSAWASVTQASTEYTFTTEGVPGLTGTQNISSLNWVGDVDGDHQPDVAFGQFTSASTTAGRVYIIR